jgi:DNA-binding MarR family transcriptional regulator
MPTTPTLNGQVIGQAHHATRALLERVLAQTGTTFHQSVALNVIAGSDPAIERYQLVGRMTGTLKIDDSAALATLAELAASQLLETLPGEESRVRLTGAGHALNRQIRSAIDKITARLHGDLPADDLATAGHVLTVVTARANAELGGA